MVDGAPFRLKHPVLVVVPPVSVATADAYERVTPRDAGRRSVCDVVASGAVEQWRDLLRNDFEAPIADAYGPVAEVRSLLREHGAAYVSLSGSGAAVYGIFTTATQAHIARAVAERAGFRVHATAFATAVN
jgi:4-diphosphocytidyl-2-C-methyl-D-erythritol kinase